MARARWCDAVFFFAALALGGCGIMEGIARGSFHDAQYCPDASIVSRARDDLWPSDYVPDGASAPGESVLDDPVRRVEWERVQADRRRYVNQHTSLYEIEGCEHHELYACRSNRFGTGCSPVARITDDGTIAPL